jgi:hypothetical protein
MINLQELYREILNIANPTEEEKMSQVIASYEIPNRQNPGNPQYPGRGKDHQEYREVEKAFDEHDKTKCFLEKGNPNRVLGKIYFYRFLQLSGCP